MRTALPGLVLAACLVLPSASEAVLINFDDVVGSHVDVTNRYAGLGVTLNAIDNPFPLAGVFPAPATVPAILGGATTWIQGFGSATSPPQVGVAASTAQTGQPGNGGILISFAFNVDSVSLVGVDNGTTGGADNESVTLSAYNAAGNLIGQTFSSTNLPGPFDQTPASISLPGMRYVAFNYTDTQFGFYAIDDLEFFRDETPVPEPSGILLIAVGLAGVLARRRRLQR